MIGAADFVAHVASGEGVCVTCWAAMPRSWRRPNFRLVYACALRHAQQHRALEQRVGHHKSVDDLEARWDRMLYCTPAAVVVLQPGPGGLLHGPDSRCEAWNHKLCSRPRPRCNSQTSLLPTDIMITVRTRTRPGDSIAYNGAMPRSLFPLRLLVFLPLLPCPVSLFSCSGTSD
jgi:hypothetical protein